MSDPGLVTEYTLVSETSGRKLVAAVNRLIAEGWQPLGGVSVYEWKPWRRDADGDLVKPTFHVAQAMVKRAL